MFSYLSDPSQLLTAAGPWVLVVVAIIVFIESGLLFPFLPGDSLIFTAGLLHEQLGLSLPVLIGVIVAAAFLGDQVGYLLGSRFGRRLFRDDARILSTKRLDAAEAFFGHYGGRAIVIGRFVPFVRTYVPLAAGTALHSYRHFVGWNALGAVLWGAGVTIAGSLLGGIPLVRNNIEVIVLLIVVVSVLPTGIEVLRQRRLAARNSG